MWHRLVDTALVVLGLGVSMASGGTAAVFGGALLGAGFSGFQTDLIGPSDSDAAWGVSIGIGAAFGGLGPAADIGTQPILGITKETLAAAAARGYVGYAGIALRVTGRVAMLTAISGTRGLVTQFVSNAIQGQPLDKNLVSATEAGLVTGAASS